MLTLQDRLDEYLTEHKLAIEVREDSHRLDNLWKLYSHVYYDLIQLLYESERMYEENRYAENNRNYHLYLELTDGYIASKEGIANVSETGDNMELAKIKVQFYEELEDPLERSLSRANSVQDLNCEEPLKNIEPKRIIKESMERDRKLEIAEHKPKIKDEKTELHHLRRNRYLERFHYLA